MLKELQLGTLPKFLDSLTSSSVELFCIGSVALAEYPKLMMLNKFSSMPLCKAVRVLRLHIDCSSTRASTDLVRKLAPYNGCVHASIQASGGTSQSGTRPVPSGAI